MREDIKAIFMVFKFNFKQLTISDILKFAYRGSHLND